MHKSQTAVRTGLLNEIVYLDEYDPLIRLIPAF